MPIQFKNIAITLALILVMGCITETEVPLQIDHIILATNNLDNGIREFQNITDLQPKYGGEHPNSDTHNATIALSERMYIEILAPKKDMDSIPEFFKEMDELTPIGFAISVNDIAVFYRRIEALGFQTNGIEEWSRKKPNGEELKWKLMMINEPQLVMNPFFIHWSEETKHSSMENDNQSYLKSLELATPYKEEIEQIFVSNHSPFGQLKLTNDNETKIKFTLQTPKGVVTFGK